MKRLRFLFIGIIALLGSFVFNAQAPASAGYSSVEYKNRGNQLTGIVQWFFHADNWVDIRVYNRNWGILPVYIKNTNGDRKKVTLYVPARRYNDIKYYREGSKPLYWEFEISEDCPDSEFLFEATWTPVHN